MACDAEQVEAVTMDQWHEHVLVNCDDSYSLTHCTAALYLAEYGSEDESDWDDKLSAAFPMLTGFQANGAKSIARQIAPLFEAAREQVRESRGNFIRFLEQAAADGALFVIADKDTPDAL